MRCHQLIVVALCTALGAACAKAHARVEAEMPLLAPPAPPPRVVEAYLDELSSTADPSIADRPPTTPAARPAVRPPAARAEKTELPRSEPERASPPPSAVASPPSPPSLTLKPAPGAEAKTERSIRELLGRASRDLGRVNYGALNADGRAQYDTARRFLQQAEDALKGGNPVFAGKLADKAATMAAVLVR